MARAPNTSAWAKLFKTPEIIGGVRGGATSGTTGKAMARRPSKTADWPAGSVLFMTPPQLGSTHGVGTDRLCEHSRRLRTCRTSSKSTKLRATGSR